MTETLKHYYIIIFNSFPFYSIFNLRDPNFVRSSLRESLSIITHLKSFVKHFFKFFWKNFGRFSMSPWGLLLSPWQLAYNIITYFKCQRFFQTFLNFFRLFSLPFFTGKTAPNIAYFVLKCHNISNILPTPHNCLRRRLFYVIIKEIKNLSGR